ncbi:GDSL-type esterase/lipase family protein [Moraxella sp. VT-16-12]|uniref:GDSL-type esterase/lipase family protein n=1 Tax=Moraxella sp. VT-16-12 TaxID=2014877 RepID=UPI000B7E7E41|nr:GDSL-type esterase/lipase family protein [Moraxella sp. VT-16-12]TWV81555.1 arylesterase [Moraxella sp. VT-16-12]
MSTRRVFLQFILTTPLALALPACDDSPKFTPLPQGTKVAALGDSLTFGYGVPNSQSYPTLLANKTGWHIINAGVNGDTTQNVLDRLTSVIDQNPKLILLGVGGNDVLRRVHPENTKNNLIQIIQALQAKQIAVILIAQPHLSASALFGKASDNPIYKEVADETGVPLFDKIWSKILSDDSLKSDQIHANGAGYAYFADELYKFLQQLGYVA